MAPEERQRIIGVIINKFRGDIELFQDGVKILEERTGIPVLGVLPFMRHLELDQEDSVEVERFRFTPFTPEKVNVAVVLLPHMSNFTDFNLLGAESDVALRYVANPHELNGADVVVLPGTKTTIEDLAYVKKEGFCQGIVNHITRGGEVVGICGGFQMLGEEVTDPHDVETGGTMNGFGFLDITTELEPNKKTTQVRAQPIHPGILSDCLVEGYEIHMGVTKGKFVQSCFRIVCSSENSLHLSKLGGGDVHVDGAVREDGLVWGTYIHGVFDRPEFRRLWLNRIRQRKELSPLDMEVSQSVSLRVAGALDRWADHVEKHLNMSSILSALGVTKS